jgi:NAD(P)-dependent dehydrogenase (short-subunit alcohol dehydrogenase family)
MSKTASARGSVLVTGASTGIGFATAKRLDALGWQVFAGVRNDADAARLREQLSERSEPVFLDVTDSAQIERARDLIGERSGGQLAGLVNNAGIVFHGPVECLTIEALRRQFEVNVVGVVAVTQAFLPFVRAARGRVVVVGSISGQVAWPFNGIYAGSKHAVRGLVESLRMEQRGFGVRFALVEPGAFATAIWTKFTPEKYIDLHGLEPHVAERYAAVMPIVNNAMTAIGKRAANPERCAAVIVRALTSKFPRARYTVGNDIWFQRVFSALPPGLKDPVMARLMDRFLRPESDAEGNEEALERVSSKRREA